MKRILLFCLVIALMATAFAGCAAFGNSDPVLSQQEEVNTDQALEENVVESDAVDEDTLYGAYAQQIQRYYTALTEQWDEGKYFENDMSALPYYYYDGNPLDNVGYTLIDLDNDGSGELVIGAILSSDVDPAVFEIWTLVDGEPVMLAQGATRNRYVLQYVAEDEMWYVANEGSNNAANHATYYLMLENGAFTVVQGIVFNAMADEQNPWFMTYDLDWDVSNDTPIDEETAAAVLEAHRVHYTAAEYTPYSRYQSP